MPSNLQLSLTFYSLSAPHLTLQILSSPPSKHIQNLTTSLISSAAAALVQARCLSPVSTPVSPRLSALHQPPPFSVNHLFPHSVLHRSCLSPAQSLTEATLFRDLPSPLITSLTSSPTMRYTLCSQLPASLLFLKHGRHVPTSQPLHWLFPPSGMFSARVAL